MTIHARLNVWRVVVVGTLLADATFATLREDAAAIVAAFLLLTMALLLVTTPPGAIRLPRARSAWMITTGTVVIAATAVTFAGQWPSVGVAITLLVATVAACFRRAVSPWSATLFAWHPLTIQLLVDRQMSDVAMLIAGFALLLSLAITFFAPRPID